MEKVFEGLPSGEIFFMSLAGFTKCTLILDAALLDGNFRVDLLTGMLHEHGLTRLQFVKVILLRWW